MISPGTGTSLAGGVLSLPWCPERFDYCAVAIDIWLPPKLFDVYCVRTWASPIVMFVVCVKSIGIVPL